MGPAAGTALADRLLWAPAVPAIQSPTARLTPSHSDLACGAPIPLELRMARSSLASRPYHGAVSR